MKPFSVRARILLAAAALLASRGATPVFAADSEFGALVSSVEQRYQVRHERIPLMGLAGSCAWGLTGGAMAGLRIAHFERADARISADDVDSFLHEKLGASWSLILRSYEKETRNYTMIYARPERDKFLILVVDIENGELSLVKLRINASRLSKWMNDHERRSTGRPMGSDPVEEHRIP
jgi:hypothetical protein